MNKSVAIIGYSGHALVVVDILLKMGRSIAGYCEKTATNSNPLKLKYLGYEGQETTIEALKKLDYFVAIGDNLLRKKIHSSLKQKLGFPPLSIVHPSAIVDDSVLLDYGTMVGAGVVINADVQIGESSICNTNATIEHQCIVEAFSHVGPGSVLCGNVHIGTGTLVGANCTVIPNKRIGANCIVGAGSVVVKNIESSQKVVGNPARII